MKYHFNPCLIGRHPALAAIGDRLASFFIRVFEEPTGGCPCCIAVRILVFATTTAVIGALGAALTIGLLA